jgi:hypothetical protein
MLSREEVSDLTKEAVEVWNSILEHDESCDKCTNQAECLDMWLLRSKAALITEKIAKPSNFLGKDDYARYL